MTPKGNVTIRKFGLVRVIVTVLEEVGFEIAYV